MAVTPAAKAHLAKLAEQAKQPKAKKPKARTKKATVKQKTVKAED